MPVQQEALKLIISQCIVRPCVRLGPITRYAFLERVLGSFLLLTLGVKKFCNQGKLIKNELKTLKLIQKMHIVYKALHISRLEPSENTHCCQRTFAIIFCGSRVNSKIL